MKITSFFVSSRKEEQTKVCITVEDEEGVEQTLNQNIDLDKPETVTKACTRIQALLGARPTGPIHRSTTGGGMGNTVQ